MKLIFSKYQGAGNDFVVVDARLGLDVELTESLVRRVCDRHFGVGADGFMLIENDAEGSDFYMRYFNCDGRESTMCGNGGRAITRFADDLGIGGKSKTFRATDGLHLSTINPDHSITLSMVDVEIIDQIGADFMLNTGSPHYVIFDKDYDLDLARALRHEFNCNVNFAKIIDKSSIKVRTFERGVERETLSCGTGATAAAIAAHRNELIDGQQCNVQTIGGQLLVKFTSDDREYKKISLTGAALRVFSGELHI